jgi:hypothetical protein
MTENPPPDRLKVGHYSYAVVIKNHKGDRLYGVCDHDEQIITLQDAYPCPGQAIDTILHEVLHALARAYRIEFEENDEEGVVDPLAGALAAFFLDNPAFLLWLAGASGAAPAPVFVVPDNLFQHGEARPLFN